MTLFKIPFKTLGSFSLLFIMTGCASDQYCLEHPQIKTVYIKQQIPQLPNEPVFQPYQVRFIVLNGEELYTLTKSDAALLAADWIDFRDYTKKIKNQYELLENAQEASTK